MDKKPNLKHNYPVGNTPTGDIAVSSMYDIMAYFHVTILAESSSSVLMVSIETVVYTKSSLCGLKKSNNTIMRIPSCIYRELFLF